MTEPREIIEPLERAFRESYERDRAERMRETAEEAGCLLAGVVASAVGAALWWCIVAGVRWLF